MTYRFLASVSFAALAVVAAPVTAQTTTSEQGSQTTPSSETPATTSTASSTAPAIVVTGVRASLQSAQNIKRNADAIVDSIVAEDIGKLPDNNATEALQRITGVQVSRDVGEGSAIAIRGLPQVETTLNGRETFTAGGGRTFNLEDLPAELISRIDVYKSPTADLIEGGLGGIVDIQTHKPFDFHGLEVTGTVSNDYADLTQKAKPSASLLVSDRWDTGIGEIGILGDISYQDRAYREDLDSTGAPYGRTDLIPGQTVYSPNGNYQVLINGDRKRVGANLALQWRPSPSLEFTLEGQYQRFKTVQDQFATNNPTQGSAAVPGSVELFNGTSDLEQASFTNVPVTASGTARDTLDLNKQLALHGKWTSGNFTLNGDVSYTNSKNDLYYSELDLLTHAPVYTQYLNTNPPSSSVSGTDLSNISNYTVGALTRSENHYKGHEWAGRLDGEYKFDGGFLSAIDVGFRYSDRTIAFTPIRFYSQSPTTDPSLVPDLFEANGFSDFYTAGGAGDLPFQRDYPHAVPDQLRNNFDGVAQELGFTTLPAVSPGSIFSADEKTYAGYIMGRFHFDVGVPVDGNIGVRVVNTRDTIVGFKPTIDATNTVTYAPINGTTSYTNALPSANLRIHLTDKLQLRLSGSQTLTRPDFSQLSPVITVVPAQLAASGGNPDLKPIKSTAADASLEWYFGRSSSVYAAAFYKRVKGFIFTSTNCGITIDGVANYCLTQPNNSGTGTVKGVEAGYQQFFDFLPGILSGLGLQANFTYVSSNAPTAVAGLSTPLPQLSKYSYNIVGIYERNGLSLRVAYNWRSKFLSTVYTGAYQVPGQTTAAHFTSPVYTQAYGWLDASLNYDVTPNLTLTVDAQNLLRTQISTYYGVPTRPGSYTIDDRQFMLGARLKF